MARRPSITSRSTFLAGRVSLVVLAFVLVGFAGSAAAWRLPASANVAARPDATAPGAIEGTWRLTGGGFDWRDLEVTVKPAGANTWVGVITHAPTNQYKACLPVGMLFWQRITRSNDWLYEGVRPEMGVPPSCELAAGEKGVDKRMTLTVFPVVSGGGQLDYHFKFTFGADTKPLTGQAEFHKIKGPTTTTPMPTTTAPTPTTTTPPKPPTGSSTLTGTVTDGHGDPVQLAYVRVTYGSRVSAAITDEKGRYRVAGLPTGKVAGFDPSHDAYRVEVWLQLMIDVKQTPRFRVLYRSEGGKPVRAVTKAFVLTRGGVRKDVDFGRTQDLQLNLSPLPAARLADVAAIYFHTVQSLYGAARLVDGKVLTPFDVVAFLPGSGACWRGRYTSPAGDWARCLGLTVKRAMIGLSESDSAYANWSRPTNREWHEYGHQFMADLLGQRMPSYPGRSNHQGYCVNDRSTDAWTEGFAEFFSLMVNKEVAGAKRFDDYHWGTSSFDFLELDYKAWNWPEEFAVAGLLLDLVDGPGSYGPGVTSNDDPVQITPKKLIDVIRRGASAENHSNGHIFDMVDLYRNLGALGVGAKDTNKNGRPDLNDVFIAHGFFANTDGDQTYEPGEEIGYTDHGTSVPNGGRPCNTVSSRRDLGDRPGGFIRFKAVEPGGKAVTGVSFKVAVSYSPPYTQLSRSYEVPAASAADGRLHLSLPPAGGAKATIVALAADHHPSKPFVLDNKTYWENLSLRNDKPLLEHTFTLPPIRPGGTPTTPTTSTTPAAGDRIPPKVQALPSSGAPGTKIELRFTSSDDSGQTREQVTVYRGDTPIAQVKTKLSDSAEGKIYGVGWDAPASITGPLRFCVQAWDAADNASAVSCAAITLTGGG